eukprot:2235152-Prymnesium_polylepis.1
MACREPYAHGVVGGARDAAMRLRGERPDGARVAVEHLEAHAAARVPHAQRVVVRTAHEQPADGAEGDDGVRVTEEH